MKLIICLTISVLMLFCVPVFAADCEIALFGPHGVFENEGGYQNYKNDSGNFIKGKNCGGTKYGLSCRSYPKLNMKTLTKAQAAKIYHDDQWAAIKGDDIKSQALARELLDLAVNMGTGSAIILLERTVNDLNGSDPDLPLVSHVQRSTIDWINRYTATERLLTGEADRTQRKLFYRTLILFAQQRYNTIAANPKQRQWLYTWSTRLIHL